MYVEILDGNKQQIYQHRSLYRSAQIAHPMPIGRVQARKISETRSIFWARTFCLVKQKKALDLQLFSRIGKTMKKLW